MSNSKIMIALVAMLATGTIGAQETDMSQEWTQQRAAERAQHAQDQSRMDALMGNMAKEMADLRATTDPKKRAALMKTHRENMRESMGLMRGMGGERMQTMMSEHAGPGMQHKDSGDASKPAHKHKRMIRPRAEMSDAERLADLENRLDMMQVMMESMMNAKEHQ